MDDRFMSLEESQLQEINRLHARLRVEKIQNRALRDELTASRYEVREWQELAVELGAFAAVTKDKARMTLDCSLTIDAGLLAQTKDRTAFITSLLAYKVRAPLIAECERTWGRQPEPKPYRIGTYAPTEPAP